MAFTLALSDARTEVIHIAGIDGKTGSNGRHSPTRLNAILNREYRALLSRAGRLGLPHGLQNATGTLGSALASEDFISLDIPSAAAEVIGVDVRGAAGQASQWGKLDPLTWEQRRDVYLDRQGGALCGGVLPKHGIGFWATRTGPSVSTTTLTQGKLAIWPLRIAGLSYTLHYVQQWTAISSDTHVFLLHDGWDIWLLNRVAMVCAQRDTNKRTNFDTAQAAWLAADAELEFEAARLNRAGSAEPTPYGGINL